MKKPSLPRLNIPSLRFPLRGRDGRSLAPIGQFEPEPPPPTSADEAIKALPPGPQGERGERGPEGKRGPRGYEGLRGPEGKPGPMGPIGPRGERGEIGLPGPQGERGERGPMGPEGIQGAPGRDAPITTWADLVDRPSTFPAAPHRLESHPIDPLAAPGQVLQASDGRARWAYVRWGDILDTPDLSALVRPEIYYVGLPGTPGPPGADGPAGPQGPAGADGAPGPIGPTGPQGPPGPVLDASAAGQVLAAPLTGPYPAPMVVRGLTVADLPADYLYTATQVVYVATYGNDSNTGLNVARPKLTIGAAITAASALSPSASNRVVVYILDAGTYAESITCIGNVDVYGPSAKIDGTVTLVDDVTVTLREIAPSSGSNLRLLRKTAGNSTSYAHIDLIDGRNCTNSACLFNQAAGSIIFLRAGKVWVGADSIGIGDLAAGFGHVHFNIADLYLAGNNAIGIAANTNNASIIGYIDHILETGSPTGTTGISVGSSGEVYATISQIIADTAYTITAGGVLGLVCPNVRGLRTGTPTSILADADFRVATTTPTFGERTLTIPATGTAALKNTSNAATGRMAYWTDDNSVGGDSTLRWNAGELIFGDQTNAPNYGNGNFHIAGSSGSFNIWDRLMGSTFPASPSAGQRWVIYAQSKVLRFFTGSGDVLQIDEYGRLYAPSLRVAPASPAANEIYVDSSGYLKRG